MNNPSVYDILNENFKSMKDIIYDVKEYRNQINELLKILDISESDSLNSILEEEVSYDQKINSIFSEFTSSKKEYIKSKNGLKRGLMRDLKKIVFIDDITNQWKNEFLKLSFDRSKLDNSITKFETELNKMIFNNDYDKRKRIKVIKKN